MNEQAKTQDAVDQSTGIDGSSDVEKLRNQLRCYADHFRQLPIESQVTCPQCQKVVRGEFQLRNDRVVLDYHCGECGPLSEGHYDAIWTNPESDIAGSPKETYSGSRINPVQRGLPRTLETLCPECCAVVIGRYFVESGKVWIEKTCPEHGHFRDIISPDAQFFLRTSYWSFEEHAGQKFPQRTDGTRCPSDCGLCNQHLSSPCLAQMDLTNKCNMKCPVCFANANASGHMYEMTYDEIVMRMQELRDLRPHPCSAIQFSGGEPTIHPDFLRVVTKAGEMGFTHIQIATNGITLANLEFAEQCVEAGLHTLYLQFDGVGEEPYRKSRNYPGIWEKKLATIENARKTGMKICLVPTLIKGVTDDQVMPILKFAIENIDVISGVSWQPVSFTGRMSIEERRQQRYTLGDLVNDLSELEGVEKMRDFFPLSMVVPLANILEAITGESKIRPSTHPNCSIGTYFLVSPEGKLYPFPAVLDVEGMFTEINELAHKIKARGKKASLLDKIRILRLLKKHWRKETAPPDLTIKLFVRSVMGMMYKDIGRGKSGEKNYRSLLCAGMHFQDRYNFDVERAKRCVILYSTSEGIFPFCTHNCGPEYRYVTL